MTRLFSYVVDHDYGYAPNPYGGICTLVHCKFRGLGRKRNIVEMAEVGDWVLGSGGSSYESAGVGKIIYLMRIDEKLEFRKYLSDLRFNGRVDHGDWGDGNEFALVSFHYYYFGINALNIDSLPSSIPRSSLFKKGPGYRSDFPPSAIMELINWLGSTYEVGMHGDPCTSESRLLQPRIRSTCDCSRRLR